MAFIPKQPLVTGCILAGVLVLYASGGDKQGTSSAPEPAASSSTCRVTVTANALNVRAAPGTNAKIVGTVKRGDQIDAQKTVQNGFRRISDNRWISTKYLAPVPGGGC